VLILSKGTRVCF